MPAMSVSHGWMNFKIILYDEQPEDYITKSQRNREKPYGTGAGNITKLDLCQAKQNIFSF